MAMFNVVGFVKTCTIPEEKNCIILAIDGLEVTIRATNDVYGIDCTKNSIQIFMKRPRGHKINAKLARFNRTLKMQKRECERLKINV